MSVELKEKRRELVYIPTGEILPNPVQPRRRFSSDALSELADSINEHGILQPLTIRLRRGRFELVAGERRLRAAKILGLENVPCILIDVTTEQSSLLALVENIQRHDLDFVEEAEGIARLIRVFGLSRDDVSKKLGKSQSAIANKLRILKLDPELLEAIRQSGLSERHARELLRLSDNASRLSAFEYIVRNSLTVSATERYIDRLLEAERAGRQRKLFILKDVRVFLNTINKGIDLMQKGGINAFVDRKDCENELILTIKIPKPTTKL